MDAETVKQLFGPRKPTLKLRIYDDGLDDKQFRTRDQVFQILEADSNYIGRHASMRYSTVCNFLRYWTSKKRPDGTPYVEERIVGGVRLYRRT